MMSEPLPAPVAQPASEPAQARIDAAELMIQRLDSISSWGEMDRALKLNAAMLRQLAAPAQPASEPSAASADVEAMCDKLSFAAGCLPSDAKRVPCGYTLLLDAAAMLRTLNANRS
jgi:hypothetical protein